MMRFLILFLDLSWVGLLCCFVYSFVFVLDFTVCEDDAILDGEEKLVYEAELREMFRFKKLAVISFILFILTSLALYFINS